MELTIDQALLQGVAAHKEGKLQEAERLYRAILQANAKHPDANHNLGVLAVGLNQVEGSLPHFKTAIEANPNEEQYWLSFIDALIKLGRMDDARKILEHGKVNGLKGEKVNALEASLVKMLIEYEFLPPFPSIPLPIQRYETFGQKY